MFHPLPLYVGLRYARARAHRYFVSFITWVSLAGVSVGVAALIVVLSVMNGFESELRDRLLAATAPLRVTAPPGVELDLPRLRAELAEALPGVRAEQHAELQVLALRQPEQQPLLLKSADVLTQGELQELLVEGNLDSLVDGEGLIIGALVAQHLGVLPGDSLTLLVPTVTAGGLPEPRLWEFTVAGIVEAGIQDHDANLAYAGLDVLTALGAGRSSGVGLNLRLDDALAAPAAAALLRERLAPRWPQLKVTDWTEDHASYFRAIRIEKTMMALILLLIVAVAAFNIVAMLVMVVTDKRTDIAILRTFGAAP